jgi:hypothetical protein
VVGRGNATPTGFGITLTFYNESGGQTATQAFTGTISAQETKYYSAILSGTGQMTAISWEHVFKDPKRGTMLKISTDDKYFQFTAPGKDFGVKHDSNMKMLWHVIVINYGDSQMRLIATAVDDCIGFCVATAWDRQTGRFYMLIDLPDPHGGSCNLLIGARLL